jgi:hypothetical protein
VKSVNKLNFLFIVSFFAIFTGCGNYQELKLEPEKGDMVEGGSVEELIFFEDVFTLVIEPNCIFCHSNYSNYQVVRDNIQSIISRVSGEGPGQLMPLGGPALDEDLIQLIRDWNSQGALEL